MVDYSCLHLVELDSVQNASQIQGLHDARRHYWCPRLPNSSTVPRLHDLFSSENFFSCFLSTLLRTVQVPHDPRSTGPLALPYMRPAPACRTFNSTAVEASFRHIFNL